MSASIKVTTPIEGNFDLTMVSIAEHDNDTIHIMRMNREQMFKLYIHLTRIANIVYDTWKEGEPPPPAKITFNGESHEYQYSTWINLYDKMSDWISLVPVEDDDGPNIELF